jgi:C4-type Zn-finger protein
MRIDRETWEQAAYLSETCPVCGRDCGVADYVPPEPDVGIFRGTFYGECSHCGWFTTTDDGVQDWEGRYDGRNEED